MSEEVKLKPCPCCGGKAVCSNRGTRFYGVFCASYDEECFCETTGHMTREDAITAWNHRPLEDAKDARIVKLVKIIRDSMSNLGMTQSCVIASGLPCGPENLPKWISDISKRNFDLERQLEDTKDRMWRAEHEVNVLKVEQARLLGQEMHFPENECRAMTQAMKGMSDHDRKVWHRHDEVAKRLLHRLHRYGYRMTKLPETKKEDV